MPTTQSSWSQYRSAWRLYRWLLAFWITNALCVLGYSAYFIADVRPPWWAFVLLLVGLLGGTVHDRAARRFANRSAPNTDDHN